MKIYVMNLGYARKLVVEMMVSAPITSEWMMTLSWKCFVIQIRTLAWELASL